MRNWTLSQIFRAAGHLWLGAVAAFRTHGV